MKHPWTIALALLFSSCASIVTGATDDILVTSEPEGAFFRTNVGQAGRTPKTIWIEDDEPLEVLFQAKGYASEKVQVSTRPSFWIIGNLLLGGPIGVLIDFAGSGRVHSTDHVHVQLRPLGPEEQRAQSARIGRVEEPPVVEAPIIETFEEWSRRQESGAPPQDPSGSDPR